MGAVNTTYTFTATDTITSAKMNNIISQTKIDTGAIFGNTLEVVLPSGQLKVRSQGITSNEMAADSVLAISIKDLNVTTAKIADLNVTTGKVADSSITAVKLATDSVEAVKIKDANVTATKLNGAQTGTAPIYGARAFGTVISSGTALSTSKGNVSGVTKISAGLYRVSFTTPMPTIDYSVVATVMYTNAGYYFATIYDKLTTSFTIACAFRDNSGDRSGGIDIDVSFVVVA
jgi:hypothetical protein